MKKYADDYDLVITEDEKGREKKKAVYRANYFKIDISLGELKTFKRKAIVLLIAIALLHFGAGFVANLGMYAFYVVLPYVISFLPLYYMGSGILRLPKEIREYRRDEVSLSFERLKKSAIFVLAILGVGAIGEIVYIITFTNWGSIREFLYLGLALLEIILVYVLLRLRNKINIKELESQQPEQEPSA
jgi:hypothetical protein